MSPSAVLPRLLTFACAVTGLLACQPSPETVAPGSGASAPGAPSADAAAGGSGEDHDHAHDEVDLGTLQLGPHAVQLAQAHGPLTAGAEAGLVVKLPYSDGGETVVRGWLGSAERTQSYIGLGAYAPSHDDYDLHALAPDPLSAEVAWWVELELPDGTRLLGSHAPLRETR